MSAKSRQAARARIAAMDAAAAKWPSIARNSAGIAGGLGFDLPAPVSAGGLVWQPDDAQPSASPIGAALASELGTPVSS